MRRIRRIVLTALLPLGFVVAASSTPAQAFCSEAEGCSPCPFEVVVQGKNTHIRWYQC